MSPIHASSTFVRPRINIGYGGDTPDGVNSLPELIEFAAQNNPNHIFGLQTRIGEDTHCEITFAELQCAVEHASSWLVDSGATCMRTCREQVMPPVAILRASDIGIFIYVAALLRIGTPVLIISARLTPVAIAHLLKETSPATVLISSQVSRASTEALGILQNEGDANASPKLMEAPGYEELLDPPPALLGSKIPARCTHYLYEDLNAFIMHSSGSTGLPKPIYHSQTYTLLFPTCHHFPDTDPAYRFNVSTLPLYHGFGLIAPSLSLSIGMPFVLPPATVIPTAKTTLAALQATGARYLLSVPSIVEDILRLPGDTGLEALQRLEVVAIGGAPMKETVGCELAEAGVNLLNHWGCTEIGPLVPIQRIPKGYDWHYLLPRTDMNLQLIPVDDGAGAFRLIGRAPHWTEPHVNQDQLVVHPHDKKQFRIMGRTDDLIVLATGEKVRPTVLEQSVAEHPRVRDVLAFGEGRAALGLLVELMATVDTDEEAVAEGLLVESLGPFLRRGNSFVDKHGQVVKEMIIFTREDTKPFVRTAKGNVARKSTLGAFAAEISACYESTNMSHANPFPRLDQEDGEGLRRSIRSLVRSVMIDEESHEVPISDDIDFFEAGMDSLQATRLRRAVLAALRVTNNLPAPVEDLEPDFCFEHSSVEKLFWAVAQIMQGTYRSDIQGSRESRRVAAMETMVERYRGELSSFMHLAASASCRRARIPGSVVLLTGSTGSLGCFLLARLARDPTVSKVICLNRRSPGSVGIHERQRSLMKSRGASMTEEAWAKVVLHEADMRELDFGLGEELQELLLITHIIHTAWPVNFNRNLLSFEPHVRVLLNLIHLSLLSARARSLAGEAPPTRFLFASSIAVAGHYPERNPNESFEVPETALQPGDTLELGYAEAKWVCESVLQAAVNMYKDASLPGRDSPVLGSSVRIGQMCGAEGSGVWNKDESIPLVVRTSLRLGRLPILEGSLSWMPVNLAADAVAELLFSSDFKPYYHLENPCRQPWSAVLDDIGSILGTSGDITSLQSLPFSAWIARARALGDERNPAFKLLHFLECHFERMSTGSIVLDSKNAKFDAPAVARCSVLNRKHLERYVAYWREIDMK